MKKSNTDRKLPVGLWQMCILNALMYASVYIVLSGVMLGLINTAGTIYPFFLIGMLAVGFFHAYLADTFRRKSIMLYSLIGIMLSSLGYTYVTQPIYYILLALLQGICFGLATSAGTTVSIDITPSGLRTPGNLWFISLGRLGMVGGMMAFIYLMTKQCSSVSLLYISAGMAGIAILIGCMVYVSFRAPIGLRLCSLDRFILPRAWLPAVNVALWGFTFGILFFFVLGFSLGISNWWLLLLLILPVCTPFWSRMFIKLSHHCQRATGVTTFNTLLDIGIISGMWAVSSINNQDKVSIEEDVLLVSSLLFSIVLFLFVTRPYYRKKRVR